MVEGTAQFTQTGGIVGMPAYMSPEQGLGTKPDGRSDIYSFGVILYEMATGRTPYHAETPMAVVIKHVQDPLPPPQSINPQIPDALERIILKALAKDRDERYPTCADLVQTIQTLSNHPPKPAIATMIEAPAADLVPLVQKLDPPATHSTSQTISPTENSLERKQWIPWAVVAAGVLGFGIIAILIVWFLLSSLKNSADDQPIAELVLPTTTESEGVLSSTAQTDIFFPTTAAVTDTPMPTEIPESTLEPTEPVLGMGGYIDCTCGWIGISPRESSSWVQGEMTPMPILTNFLKG